MSAMNQVRDDQMEGYASFFSGSSTNAISGLAEMVGRTIEVTSTEGRRIPVKDAPELIGGWEALVVGVYLGVSGSANGHIFLAYEPKTALELVDLMMCDPIGTAQTLGEMEQSALGELGNIMGSYFLNNLAVAAGL